MWLGLVALAALSPAREVRVYFIGNSVTDTVNYGALAHMANARGIHQTWGRQMIPGAPLDWLWDHQEGFTEAPYGPARNALGNYPWDAVTVQPFDRHLEDDVAVIQRYFDLASKKNPKANLFIYARWPRMTVAGKGFDYDKNAYDPKLPATRFDYSRLDSFADRWKAKYTGGWDVTNETQDYFEKVVREMRKRNPSGAKRFRMIPVGQVLFALDQEMRAGKVPGFQTVYQLYNDGIHLGSNGSFLVGCTFFATLYGQNPAGLDPAPYGQVDAEIARVVPPLVWRIVRQTALTEVH